MKEKGKIRKLKHISAISCKGENCNGKWHIKQNGQFQWFQVIWKVRRFCNSKTGHLDHIATMTWRRIAKKYKKESMIHVFLDVKQRTYAWFTCNYIVAKESFIFNHCITKKIRKTLCCGHCTWLLFTIFSQRLAHCARFWYVIQQFTICNIFSLILKEKMKR